MIKIGDEVKKKGSKNQQTFEVMAITESSVKLKTKKLEFWVDIDEVELSKDCIKTNRIRRIPTDSIIEYKIAGDMIEFNVTEHPMMLSTALKIILHETELYNYKYKRISPFKLNVEYESLRHKHILTYIDVHKFEKRQKEIINTDCLMRLEGKYKMFIPDFLEVCVERGILERTEDGHTPFLDKINEIFKNCEYLPSIPSISQLEKEGFIIPSAFKERF